MLILDRKIEEIICIYSDGRVKIKILNIRGKHVKLGIEAPKEVPVNREEVYQLIKSKNLLSK